MDQKKNDIGRRSPTGSGPELPRYMNARPNYAQSSAPRNSHASLNTRSAPAKPKGSANSAARSARSTPSRAGASSSTRRAKKPSRAQRLMHISVGIFIALLLLVGSIYLLLKAQNAPLESIDAFEEKGDTFYSGIAVANVELGGLTVSQAKDGVEKAIRKEMGSISIVLQHDGNSYTLTSSDMELSIDIDALLLSAMNYGRGNSEEAAILKAGGKSFPAKYMAKKEAVISKLNEIASEINTAPVEPHLIPSLTEDLVQQFEPAEGRNGLSLNAEATAALVLGMIDKGDYTGTITPVFDETKPSMTLDFLLANKERIATFTTKYRQSRSDEVTQNRVFNIQKTADLINLQVVYPGEAFSFNGVCGPRTKETGWKQAAGISGGKEYTMQYGGGICQVSTTLYGAILRGNISIPEGGRKKHSIPSSYVDYGLDATVDTSGIDFQFINNTDAPIYIFAYTKEVDRSTRTVTVSLYGRPLPEGVTYEPRSEVTDVKVNDTPKYVDDPSIPLGYELKVIEARDAYTAQVYLQKFENGQKVDEKLLYKETYRGNPAEIHRGTGDRATVPVPQGATLMPGYEPITPPSSAHPGDPDIVDPVIPEEE